MVVPQTIEDFSNRQVIFCVSDVKAKGLVIIQENTGKFKCRFCDASFWFVEYLKKHLAMEHVKKIIHFDKNVIDNISTVFEDLALSKKINFMDEESDDLGMNDLKNLIKENKGLNEKREESNQSFRVEMTQVNTTDEELLLMTYKIGCWNCVNCQNCYFSGMGDLAKGLRRHWEENHSSDNVLSISPHWMELKDVPDLLGNQNSTHESESKIRNVSVNGIENESESRNLRENGTENESESRNLRENGTENERERRNLKKNGSEGISRNLRGSGSENEESLKITNFETRPNLKRECNGKIQCDRCEKMFNDNAQHKQHVCIKNTRECIICHTHVLITQYYKHMKSHHVNIQPGTCEICMVYFPKSEMEHHRMVFHELGHKCPICGKFFVDKSALSRHREICIRQEQVKAEMFQCENCVYTFSSNKDLIFHKFIRHDIAEHECKFCQEKFHTEYYYLSHMKKYHTQCLICDRYFCNDENLGSHKCAIPENRTKKKRKRKKYPPCTEKLMCEKCGDFVLKTSFSQHMDKHNETGVYCDQCGKRFAHRGSLYQHSYSHKQTTYTCKICNIVYDKHSSYRAHMEHKHKPPTHKCPTCGIKFHYQFRLKEHVESVHEKKTRFSCSLCSFQTFYKMNFNSHMSTQHPGAEV